jgi:hypothetical protein
MNFKIPGPRSKFLEEDPDYKTSLSNYFQRSKSEWRCLLRSFKLHQVDLHVVNWVDATPLTMGFRTLVQVWVGSDLNMIQALSDFLNAWLSDLSSLEVPLLSYGEEEKRLQYEGIVFRNFTRHTKNTGFKTVRDYSYGTLRLVSFQPSSSPDDWKLWWSEPTDEFAGDFWRICERAPESIPGAWDKDFD